MYAAVQAPMTKLPREHRQIAHDSNSSSMDFDALQNHNTTK
jgi:hypothetical protein